MATSALTGHCLPTTLATCTRQAASGSLLVNGQALQDGDAARLDDEGRLVLAGRHDTEVLLFDLAR